MQAVPPKMIKQLPFAPSLPLSHIQRTGFPNQDSAINPVKELKGSTLGSQVGKMVDDGLRDQALEAERQILALQQELAEKTQRLQEATALNQRLERRIMAMPQHAREAEEKIAAAES